MDWIDGIIVFLPLYLMGMMMGYNQRRLSFIASMIHSLASCVLGVRLFHSSLYNLEINLNDFRRTSLLSLSYFSIDLIFGVLMTPTLVETTERSRSASNELRISRSEKILEILHHILAICVAILYLHVPELYIYPTFLLMSEIPVPFINIGYVLRDQYKEWNILNVINGIALLVTFVIFRVILIPYGYYLDYANIHDNVTTGRLIDLSTIIIILMNTFWTYKIIGMISRYLSRFSRYQKTQHVY